VLQAESDRSVMLDPERSTRAVVSGADRRLSRSRLPGEKRGTIDPSALAESTGEQPARHEERHMNSDGWLRRFFATDASNSALFIQRLVLGLVMFPHGAQKVLGWYGGHGFSKTMESFTSMNLPAPIAFLVIVGEFFGALMLILGLGTRLAAFGITLIMIGAIVMAHWHMGFFMNWHGAKEGEGFEYHLLALALSIPLMIWGGGRYSIDAMLAKSASSQKH
jgi:putative oxidoreductase